MDIHLVLADEVQQQVEGPLESIEPYAVILRQHRILRGRPRGWPPRHRQFTLASCRMTSPLRVRCSRKRPTRSPLSPGPWATTSPGRCASGGLPRQGRLRPRHRVGQVRPRGSKDQRNPFIPRHPRPFRAPQRSRPRRPGAIPPRRRGHRDFRFRRDHRGRHPRIDSETGRARDHRHLRQAWHGAHLARTALDRAPLPGH